MIDAKLIAEMKRELIGRGVEYCLATYVDVHGAAKAKTIPIASFEKMAGGSELFTVGAMEGHGPRGAAGGRMRRGAGSREHDDPAVGQALCLVCQRPLLPRRALCKLLPRDAQARVSPQRNNLPSTSE